MALIQTPDTTIVCCVTKRGSVVDQNAILPVVEPRYALNSTGFGLSPLDNTCGTLWPYDEHIYITYYYDRDENNQ